MADVGQQSTIGNMAALANMLTNVKGGASVASAIASVVTNASSLTGTIPQVLARTILFFSKIGTPRHDTRLNS